MKRSAYLFLSLVGTTLSLMSMQPSRVNALSGSDWQAGNIINDAVFTDATNMTVSQIQDFLNQQVPDCDVSGSEPASDWGRPDLTHAQYATQVKGWAGSPYVCLKSYYEVPKTSPTAGMPDNSYNHYDAASKTLQPVPGGVSAAQLIYNAAQQYQISPKVLLVKLQTESAGPLTQDNWPLSTQYTYAMGAHCPDSGPGGSAQCDPNYAGFSIQISEAASLLRYYLDNMQQPWWTYKVPFANNSVLWNVSQSGCGGSNVYISTKATAALYTYTPYQPNATALAKVSNASSGGLGDNCSAYGNRNFWWWFSNFFGSTQTNIAYSWQLLSQAFYTDSSYSDAKKYTSPSTINAQPGSTVYVKVRAKNMGYQTWQQDVVHIGTAKPNDRTSAMSNNTWLSPGRIGMQDTSVRSGDTATFQFTLSIPNTPGTYFEGYNLVADGVTWLNDPGAGIEVNATNRRPDTPSTTHPSSINSGATLPSGGYMLAGNGAASFSLSNTGTLVLSVGNKGVWSNSVNQTTDQANYLVMQGDGNLVVYGKSGKALWDSGTASPSNAGATLALQGDGNLVIYKPDGTAVWSTATNNTPDLLQSVFPTIQSGNTLLGGQALLTANQNYWVAMQEDGNLVAYSKSGKPLWNSGTFGQGLSAVLQGDGNLVIYNMAGKPLWNSGTFGQGQSSFVIQGDGNAVIYNQRGVATWSSKYGRP